MKENPMFYCFSSPLEASLHAESSVVYGQAEWSEKYGSAEWDKGIEFEQIRCQLEPWKHSRNGKRIGNLRLVLKTSHITDIIWTVYRECVVTDRVLQLLKEAKYTGFQPRDASIVKVKDRKGPPSSVPKVWELEITGSGGEADPLSGIRPIYVCSSCGLRRYSSFRNGILVNPSHWNGSDFFTLNGYPALMLVTERVKDFIVRNQLTNCVLIPSQDLKWGDSSRPEDHPEYFMSTQNLASEKT